MTARAGDGHRKHREKVLKCPRCHKQMKEHDVNGAMVDECREGHGVFFDRGEMFVAIGSTADASYWDREGVAGPTRRGETHCPRCHGTFHLQDVEHGGEKVEIDRCGTCAGIWLDAGEGEKLMRIGDAMRGALEAEQAAARAELDKMGDVDFNAGGFLYKFMSLFKRSAT